jgi:hypothetical protein
MAEEEWGLVKELLRLLEEWNCLLARKNDDLEINHLKNLIASFHSFKSRGIRAHAREVSPDVS